MAKYMLYIRDSQPFKNAWNDDEKDFWVAHAQATGLSISDANFEKVIRGSASLDVVDGSLVITDITLGANKVSLDEIKNGLETLIFELEEHIKNNAENPSNLPQDLINLKTLQTAVNNDSAGLTFDGDGKTPGFSWVDALYTAGNTVAPVTFI